MSKEHKQQLTESPVYIQIFKEERMPDLYAKMGEQYQLFDSYKICRYSDDSEPEQRQGDFKSPEGFYSVQRNQLKPDNRYYKAINTGSLNTYDRAYGYEGKYPMIYGDCISIGCYTMTNQGISEIPRLVISALVFGQPSVRVSIYPFRMIDANMRRHKYSNFKDFWEQLKPNYDCSERTREPSAVSVVNGRYMISKLLSHEVVQPQLVSSYTLPKAK